MDKKKTILRRLGPGLITASLVLGPGSIVSASRAGAERGYGLLWVMVLSGVFMATYTAMSARLGCALGDTTPLKAVPRWLAGLVGFSAFLVCAGFQFGNNIGVAVALSTVTGTPGWIWPLVFTGISLLFLLTAKHLYKMLERLMMTLVAVMICAFVANLFWTGISVPDLLEGLVPRFRAGDQLVGRAMLATTFSVVGALYQAYLVQAKKWGREDLADAIKDAWIGIAVLVLISAVIMIGAAQVLYGAGKDFQSAGQLAQILEGLLGSAAVWVFCLGLAAASFSSFIINAMVGGNLFADGLGFDARIDARATKVLTTVVMLAGCGVAVATMVYKKGNTQSLLLAQASTLLAAPLSALLLFVLTSRRKTMGELRNGPVTLVIGALGFLAVLWLGFQTLMSLLAQFTGA